MRLVRGCGVPALSRNRGFTTAKSVGSDGKFLWHGGESSERKEGELERRSWGNMRAQWGGGFGLWKERGRGRRSRYRAGVTVGD
jgi:hypothetical protein